MNEQELRKLITVLGKSLFDRRYTAGGSGNISVRIDDGILTTRRLGFYPMLDFICGGESIYDCAERKGRDFHWLFK